VDVRIHGEIFNALSMNPSLKSLGDLLDGYLIYLPVALGSFLSANRYLFTTATSQI
jgi:hypothetical protein